MYIYMFIWGCGFACELSGVIGITNSTKKAATVTRCVTGLLVLYLPLTTSWPVVAWFDCR